MKKFKTEEVKQKALNILYNDNNLSKKNVDSYINGWLDAQKECDQPMKDDITDFIKYFSDKTDKNSFYQEIQRHYGYSGYTSLPQNVNVIIDKYDKICDKLKEVVTMLDEVYSLKLHSKDYVG